VEALISDDGDYKKKVAEQDDHITQGCKKESRDDSVRREVVALKC